MEKEIWVVDFSPVSLFPLFSSQMRFFSIHLSYDSYTPHAFTISIFYCRDECQTKVVLFLPFSTSSLDSEPFWERFHHTALPLPSALSPSPCPTLQPRSSYPPFLKYKKNEFLLFLSFTFLSIPFSNLFFPFLFFLSFPPLSDSPFPLDIEWSETSPRCRKLLALHSALSSLHLLHIHYCGRSDNKRRTL